MGRNKFVFALAFILIFGPIVSSLDFNHVIINSENWKDIYSGVHYANLNKVDVDFLTSEQHSKILASALNKSEDLLVLSSRSEQYAFNYQDLLASSGFDSPEELSFRNMNLELIDELEGVNNFIIISDLYGYTAIAVAPYAVRKNSWVIFADSSNIDEVDRVLSEKSIGELLIYGYVDSEVSDSLEKYSPVVISNGDRFQDNVDIVKKFLELQETKQVLLTNGDFLESELMLGVQPVLFTGKEKVPDQIKEYIMDSPFEVGVLIGNDLMGAATNIRKSTGISVMVKFARGARVQSGGISAVEGLDIFPLPSPIFDLSVYSVQYNKITNEFEITYRSQSSLPVYVRGTLTVDSDEDRFRIGDNETIFINPQSYKTVTYPAGDFIVKEDAEANLFVIYGETKRSLDRVLDGDYQVKTIEILDQCDLEIESVYYSKQEESFSVKVKNVGEVDCYFDAVIQDLDFGIETRNVGSVSSSFVEGGKSQRIVIPQDMSNSDLLRNNFVNVLVSYGERETSLVNREVKTLELGIRSVSSTTYMILGLIVGAVGFFAVFLSRRKKEKESFNF